MDRARFGSNYESEVISLSEWIRPDTHSRRRLKTKSLTAIGGSLLLKQGENMNNEVLLVDPEGAAQSYGISRSKMYQLIASGEVESFKIGRSRRISVKALEAYVERLSQEARGA